MKKMFPKPRTNMLKYKVNFFEALYMSSVIKVCFLELGIVAKGSYLSGLLQLLILTVFAICFV